MNFPSKIFALLCVCSQLLFSQSKEIQFLTGKDAEHTKEWDFWISGGRKAGSWNKIQVPSQWEQQGFGIVITKKPIVAKENELLSNPRARSAKLRGFQKI